MIVRFLDGVIDRIAGLLYGRYRSDQWDDDLACAIAKLKGHNPEEAPISSPFEAIFQTPIGMSVDALEIAGRPGAAMLLNTLAALIALNRVDDSEFLKLGSLLTDQLGRTLEG